MVAVAGQRSILRDNLPALRRRHLRAANPVGLQRGTAGRSARAWEPGPRGPNDGSDFAIDAVD